MNQRNRELKSQVGLPEAGCNLLYAERFARKRGFVIKALRRTGECIIYHPEAPGSRGVKYNSRRKDAPRKMTTLIRQVLINMEA